MTKNSMKTITPVANNDLRLMSTWGITAVLPDSSLPPIGMARNGTANTISTRILLTSLLKDKNLGSLLSSGDLNSKSCLFADGFVVSSPSSCSTSLSSLLSLL
uniref:Uncharacterized protein n=1 Tax=Cacopsylla melanoneura TaxID=428564 RepID=A0A8D8R4X7_9HEMI